MGGGIKNGATLVLKAIIAGKDMLKFPSFPQFVLEFKITS